LCSTPGHPRWEMLGTSGARTGSGSGGG
jgi:hypothetical protein